MMQKFFLLAYLLQMANAAPQFITFKDGKIGVNFGGYHAAAGLGGLLTGDAAHGGLSASAGTPYGQRAGAGLGGSVDGNAGGLLYAGAEANPQVGAGAVLGGDTSRGGFIGSQAYAGGKTVVSTKNHVHPSALNGQVETVTNGVVEVRPETEGVYVQKIRPPKKYHLSKHYVTVLNRAEDISTVVSTTSKNTNYNGDSNDDDNGDGSKTVTSIAAAAEKAKAAHATDVQHPRTSTTKSAKRINIQQNGNNTSQSAYAENFNNNAATPPTPPPSQPSQTTIVVNKQRLRQKSRIRPQHQKKLQRQQQRQRERLAHAQHVHGTEIEAGAGNKYYTPSSEANIPETRYLTKSVETQQFDYPAPAALPETSVNIRPAVVTSALNIPIGILRSLQESLGGLSVAKQGSIVKIA